MERDDLIVNESYALNAHHSEEAGVKIRKNIIKVTVILTVITIIEVLLGANFQRNGTFTWDMIVTAFIVLTLIKAGYIVFVFMHLGDERKNFQRTILIPYIFFMVYMIILITIIEGSYQGLIQTLPF
jgi:caa(3)-type oxidase subunit IV